MQLRELFADPHQVVACDRMCPNAQLFPRVAVANPNATEAIFHASLRMPLKMRSLVFDQLNNAFNCPTFNDFGVIAVRFRRGLAV